MSEWIIVPHWDRFQHYKDREPTWIKLYTELNSDDKWASLSLAARGLLVTIWVEYARSVGVLSTRSVLRLCGKSARSAHLTSLVNAGLIELSASKPLALRARSREGEEELNKKQLLAREDPAGPQLLAFPEFLDLLKTG